MKREFHNPETMYKFGQTTNIDAAERVSVEYSEKYNFRAVPLGRDYLVSKVVWSAWVDKDQAYELEKSFKDNIPKLLYTDILYNGITECRVLTQEQYSKIRDNLYERFPKPEYNWKPGKQKVYFMRLTKKPKPQA